MSTTSGQKRRSRKWGSAERADGKWWGLGAPVLNSGYGHSADQEFKMRHRSRPNGLTKNSKVRPLSHIGEVIRSRSSRGPLLNSWYRPFGRDRSRPNGPTENSKCNKSPFEFYSAEIDLGRLPLPRIQSGSGGASEFRGVSAEPGLGRMGLPGVRKDDTNNY